MIKDLFIPTIRNNYSPMLLRKGMMSFYTLIILVFNIATANITSLRAYAAVDSQSLLALHNQERRKNNLPELTLNSKLVQSAQMKAEAMLESNCWDHYCPDGKSPWDFFDEAGYGYIYAGENLAEGFTDNNKVFSAWMNSKTHKENILRKDFNEVGIAIVYGDYQDIENNAVIVVHFGTRLAGALNSSPESQTTTQSSGSFAIQNPSEDEIINTNTPEISGLSPDGTVSITEDKGINGESIAKDGIFTYRVPGSDALVEGSHTIKASHSSGLYEDEVKFSVDTISPVLDSIKFDSITQSKNEDKVILTVNSSSDTMSIESSMQGISFSRGNDSTWEISIPTVYFEKNSIDQIKLTAYDSADNMTEKIFGLSQVKQDYEQSASNLHHSGIEVNFIKELGVRRIVNVVFILVILSLILSNYYILSTTQLPASFVKTKLNYHIGMLLLLVIVTLAGGTSGELLDGKSL